jgi:hypothetical protein
MLKMKISPQSLLKTKGQKSAPQSFMKTSELSYFRHELLKEKEIGLVPAKVAGICTGRARSFADAWQREAAPMHRGATLARRH